MRFLYPLSSRIYGIFKKYGKEELLVKKESIERLCVNEDTESAVRREACKTISYVLVIFILTGLIGAAVFLRQKTMIDDGKLPRSKTGEGEEQFELIVGRQEQAAEEITVSVSERRLTGEELNSYMEEACRRLETDALKNNLSAEEVSEDLVLLSGIEGTSIKVTWEDIDHTYVFSSGEIRHESVTEPVIIYLTARLEYFDEVRIHSFPVRLIPKKKDSEESFLERLDALLEEEDDRSSDSEWFTLPVDVDGQEIFWDEKKSRQWIWVILLGLGAAAAVIPAMRSEVEKKEKEREEEMLRDYPDIVSKIVLLITAGMTCRGAWERICADYRQRGIRRYAYEEMLKSAHELNFGLGEAKVYEDFGRRCNVAAYRKLGMLLANNLRRGSRDMTVLLEQEAKEAFNGRTDAVRKQAAEAGTRLLLPMFGMLCLVFAIVMVPAFSAFGG